MKEPDKRMDPWKEALLCYEEISEEVVVVGGNLKEEFKWSELGKMIQEGMINAQVIGSYISL